MLQHWLVSHFVVQRTAHQLVAKLAEFLVQLIANGAKFMKDTMLALCANIAEWPPDF